MSWKASTSTLLLAGLLAGRATVGDGRGALGGRGRGVAKGLSVPAAFRPNAGLLVVAQRKRHQGGSGLASDGVGALGARDSATCTGDSPMTRRTAVLSVVLAVYLAAGSRGAEDALRREFLSPPDSAKAWCYWWWLQRPSKEGITRNLRRDEEAGDRRGVLLRCRGGRTRSAARNS